MTGNTLPGWIKSEAPLHPAYEFLSAVHRSDYLRPYFMHHYGGGYADIKATTTSWRPAFDLLDRSPDAFGIGYSEKSAKGVAHIHRHTLDGDYFFRGEPANKYANLLRYRYLRLRWRSLIGMCAYVFKPGTEFTSNWLQTVEKRLDALFPLLKERPASDPRQSSDTPLAEGTLPYPVPWSFLCADVIHPLVYQYRGRVLQGLPTPSFKNYQ
ncbi:hypothetical protein [Roseibium sp.]|uniref:hypothetical protein n=1 Tax=Roseibium sp. TaxID=1936156 RepID=UPI003A9693C7